jgi:hypothetical protein
MPRNIILLCLSIQCAILFTLNLLSSLVLTLTLNLPVIALTITPDLSPMNQPFVLSSHAAHEAAAPLDLVFCLHFWHTRPSQLKRSRNVLGMGRRHHL